MKSYIEKGLLDGRVGDKAMAEHVLDELRVGGAGTAPRHADRPYVVTKLLEKGTRSWS